MSPAELDRAVTGVLGALPDGVWAEPRAIAWVLRADAEDVRDSLERLGDRAEVNVLDPPGYGWRLRERESDADDAAFLAALREASRKAEERRALAGGGLWYPWVTIYAGSFHPTAIAVSDGEEDRAAFITRLVDLLLSPPPAGASASLSPGPEKAGPGEGVLISWEVQTQDYAPGGEEALGDVVAAGSMKEAAQDMAAMTIDAGEVLRVRVRRADGGPWHYFTAKAAVKTIFEARQITFEEAAKSGVWQEFSDPPSDPSCETINQGAPEETEP